MKGQHLKEQNKSRWMKKIISDKWKNLKYRKNIIDKISGQNHYKWVGLERIHNGYIFIWNGKRRVKKSRYKIEKKFGRKLDKNEIIHHKDKNKLNDKLSNLAVISRGEHNKIHLRNLNKHWKHKLSHKYKYLSQ